MTAPATKERKIPQPKAWLWWIIGLLVLAAAAIAWFNGGREALVLALQPGFEAKKIDLSAQTMLVSRLNETYLVKCAQSCDLFAIGKTYKMRMEGPGLAVIRRGRRIVLPILEEHIEFETPPGGHG